MDIRLLGPVEVRHDGAEIVIGARMPRTLLAVLAADAGRPVQADTLVERLWGSDPPHRPRHTLHVYVSRVRAALGPDLVVRRSGGYALDVPPGAVDVHRFRAFVAAGRLSAALELSQGVPLEDLSGPWAEGMRTMWERRYVDAAVAWAWRQLESGDPQAVVGRLGDLCDRHPLAEPLSAALLLALDAAGRRAEALHRFAEIRRWLRSELGAEPGAQLRAIHLRLLRSDLPRDDAPLEGPPPAPKPFSGSGHRPV
jgi:DNA-binding SARP family transcriptional activator